MARSLLITDLDNTLWDWVDVWYRSFSALMDSLASVTGLPRETLEREAYEIHQRRHTAEYSYLVNELPSLQRIAGRALPSDVYDEAIHRQNSARLEAITLYPGVLETLTGLKNRGVGVIAYTESVAFWTEWRIVKTGLDGIIDVLYSAPDHDLPDGASFEEIRFGARPQDQLTRTVHEHVPRGILKPAVEVLNAIVSDSGRTAAEVVYVGDSLMKDVAMAKEAGVLDVWAKYGVALDKPEYELLRRVTHWSKEDVKRERALASRPTVTPSVTLTEFSQVNSLFEE